MLRGRIGVLYRGLTASRAFVSSARRTPLASINGNAWSLVSTKHYERFPAVFGTRGMSDIKIDFVDPEAACKMVTEEGALILDVRGEREFMGGALPGAENIPHDDPDLIEMVAEMTKSDLQRPILVYDKVGKRAETAKNMLNKAGYSNVANLGGMRQVEEFVQVTQAKA